MSSQSSLIAGIFSVSAGNCISTPSKKSAFPVRHTFYQSAILGLDETSFPTDIRIYSPPNDSPVLPDHTLIFLLGRFATQTKSDLDPPTSPSDIHSPPTAAIDAIFGPHLWPQSRARHPQSRPIECDPGPTHCRP